jgi:FO synthase subunit 2
VRAIKEILADARAGDRMTTGEALILLSAKGRDIYDILKAADELREEKVGPVVTYVRNQNIHITNICKNLCGFCAFGRRATDEGAFCDDQETLRRKVLRALENRVTEICLLSGVHPDFDADRYTGVLSCVRETAPGIHIHAFSPDEVSHAAAQSGLTTRDVLSMFRSAGLGSLQGTAAEILVDSVRGVICPSKVSSAEWVRIIREAHAMGIFSTATIMYGSCETPADRVSHLSILRDIQDETGGFSELVPLSFLHQNTRLYREGLAPAGATGREDLLMIAVSRLFLDNFRNIQVSWGKIGLKMAQLALQSGANDLAGTMFSDEVSESAGALGADYFEPAEMERICRDIGRDLRQRLTDYTLV